MKNKFKIIVLIVVSLCFCLSGCNFKNIKENDVTAIGSTTMQPLVEELAENFSKNSSAITVNVQGGGSGSGINQVISGNADIGNSDILAETKIKDKNLLKNLKATKICGVGFVIVASKDVNVDTLTKKQIQDIFTGKITNWKDVGGNNEKINVINRSKSSGTRFAFTNKIMGNKVEREDIAITQDSSGNVKMSLKQNKGAISYLGSIYITDNLKKDLKTIKINNVEYSIKNISNGKYPFWSYEYMYTNKKPKKATQEFLNFILNKKNQKLIEDMGYIPLDKLPK